MMDSGNGSKEMASGNLCRNGCGFYGSAATEGMCSKCFKDHQRKKQNSPVQASLASSATTPTSIAANSISPSSTTPTIPGLPTATACTTTTSFSASSSSSSNSDPEKSEDGATAASNKDYNSSDKEASPSPAATDSPDGSDGEKGKKKRNRCHTCRKKVGLTGFECRCGGLYCSIHRYSDKHDCSFDYRSHGKEEIRKNNPVVIGEKIQKL